MPTAVRNQEELNSTWESLSKPSSNNSKKLKEKVDLFWTSTKESLEWSIKKLWVSLMLMIFLKSSELFPKLLKFKKLFKRLLTESLKFLKSSLLKKLLTVLLKLLNILNY